MSAIMAGSDDHEAAKVAVAILHISLLCQFMGNSIFTRQGGSGVDMDLLDLFCK
jgi:hypothetical protein